MTASTESIPTGFNSLGFMRYTITETRNEVVAITEQIVGSMHRVNRYRAQLDQELRGVNRGFDRLDELAVKLDELVERHTREADHDRSIE